MFNIIRNKVQLFGLLHKYYLCVVKQSKEKTNPPTACPTHMTRLQITDSQQ